jgi:DNA-binding response OmpR family regulator
VSEAGTVLDAITALNRHPPDWILLDLMLPDGCGISVLKKVQADALPSKVCIVTGCAWDMLNEARKAGAEHTFTKPLDLGKLMGVLGARL